MTANELRELADDVAAEFYDDIRKAAAYLRACADALYAGPVAWTDGYGSAVTRTELKGREPHEFTADPDMLAYRIPLYPVAMPAPQPVAAENTSPECVVETAEREHIALRLPEPMTDAEVFAAMDRYEVEGYDIARWAEAETLRRVKEANE